MQANRTLFVLVPCLMLVFANSAFPQQATEQAPRGYVAVFSGIEFVPAGAPDVVFAAEYAEHVSRDVQAYVMFTYFENLVTASLEDELTALAAILSRQTGTPWTLQARDRGVSFMAGAKQTFGAPGSDLRPYVGGGAGVLNIRRTIREPRIGDVTTAVLNDYGIGRASLIDASETVPMIEVLVGLGYFAGESTYVDIGYRYRPTFRLDDGLNLSQLSAGIGYRF